MEFVKTDDNNGIYGYEHVYDVISHTLDINIGKVYIPYKHKLEDGWNAFFAVGISNADKRSWALDAEEMVGIANFLQASLSMEERLKLFDSLTDGYCKHCGIDNPDCQCWNDE